MSLKSTTMKTVAVVTAAGALTVGGATAAMAVDGSTPGTSSGTVSQRLRAHPGIRQALRTAFAAAADTLGMTARELRTQMVEGHQSLATIAGDRSDEVASVIVASLSASIDQAVVNGVIAPDRAEQAKTRLPERVERLMNRVPGQTAQ